MKRAALGSLLALIALGMAGCSKDPALEPSDAPPVDSKAEGPVGSGVTPMTTTPIPNAPVTGSETLQGGGSGIGQAMKGRAKDIASGPGPGSDQPPMDEDDGG